ncbi:MAG TPA: carboxypeptidase regulatory-like domain-containing protein [Pirellulales bacterium]|nr:carboxypeptidase regulatory-like domain-containing protein [Pirellulales bacterium]
MVRGMVCDHESGQSVAGVEIVLSNGAAEATVRSDATGKYEGRIPPGLITGVVKQVPSRYAKPHRAYSAPVSIAIGVEELTLPKIELPPGRNVRGQVVDDDGRPVPEAEVQVCWVAMEPWLGSMVFIPKRLATTADAQGAFLLGGLDPLDRVLRGIKGARILASKGRLATAGLLEFAEHSEQPLVLHLSERQATSLEGRVLDADGRPVAGAEVQFWTQWQSDDAFQLGYAPVSIGGQAELATDAEGRFRTPGRIGRGVEIAAFVRAEGYLPARTAWTRGKENETSRFADLKLTRLRTVSGQVLDRQGRPLAGVRVFQEGDGVARTETNSDAAGRYELPGVSEAEAFLFAQHAGFRFHGQELARKVTQVEITMARADEPPQSLPPQSPPMNRDAELKLVLSAYRPYFEHALAGDDLREQWDALFGWICLHPGDALASIDNGALPNRSAQEYDFLRRRAAKALFRGDPEDALAVIESIGDADHRLRTYFELAGSAPASQQDLKRQLLEEAQLNIGAVQDAVLRATWLHCVADGLLDLGDADRAREVLKEGQTLAETLPQAGDGGAARGYVAEVLARVDLPAAIELMQEIGEDKVRDRTFGRMAFRIAATQPADAERLLVRIIDPHRFDERLVPACWRMAEADPVRACRLVDRIHNPYLKAHSLGLMARSRAASDRSQARLWLDEAFGILNHIIAAGEDRLSCNRQDAAIIAGALVEAAEQIDVQLVPEYFWRAIACRRSHTAVEEDVVQFGTASLAMFLARYDRRVARTLIEPFAEQRIAGAETSAGAMAFTAACAIDPRWARELLDKLEPASAHARRRAAFSFAWHFGVPPEIRAAAEVRNFNLFWLPGEPDNAFQSEF